MKTIFALIAFFSFALADEWQTCQNIGMYLDKTNNEATLTLEYSTSGINADLEQALVVVFTEFTPAQEPQTILFHEYALALYPTAEGKTYVIAITALTEDKFIMCGFEVFPQAPSSGVTS